MPKSAIPLLPPPMANTSSASTPSETFSTEEVTVKSLNKRYEGLVTVKTKAIRGKGAWYWAHFEPVLIKNPDTNLPKAVKLKCILCNAAFSASNPSRTASEHLKRGTCPNFGSVSKAISLPPSQQLPPLASPSSSSHNHKKRNTQIAPNPVAVVTPTGFNQQHFLLSGGKEDLGALALLESSVKKLKSPKSSPGPVLSKGQVDSAFGLLADWVYQSCGSVSISSLEHPRFRDFLGQVGLPALSSRREFLGARLDSKFDEAKTESEARIREALFFQLASNGWKSRGCGYGDENLVKFSVNLPNGTSVFQKAVFMGSNFVPPDYAEEVLWESTTGVCEGDVHRCVGIVADKYGGKALRNLEMQNHWMVNLSCQLQGFMSLGKDFIKELPLFKSVIDNCSKVANVFNYKSQVRNSFQRYRSEDTELPGLIRVPPRNCDSSKNFASVVGMVEDIMSCGRVLHLVTMDESYKVVCVEDPLAREVAEMIQDVGFWNELDAAHSLVKLIKGMAEEIEAERPLVGQCLPLWEELRAKMKDWCAKFRITEGPVFNVVEKRFRKNYHPAWSAAFILDPQYLTRDASGKYLPPFKCLTNEQEKDVDRLITRLVSREEAHIALMELMKWRSEGLDPLYAQAVQVKQRDPVTGKMRMANPKSSRLVWETCLKEFKSLGKVAVRLLFLHATSCGFKCNWSFMRWVCLQGNSRVGLDRAQKMIFVSAHSKLESRDFSSEEEKDAELFAMASGDDDMLSDVFADAPSV
ncbi:hypothetical protein RHMOL_Rhmol03G0197200 [Rhododendron molle]|uniref:Uncharacterized protein n=1 Tax=Rhododendron molle TaxID=49168 RepID=A0ACC0PHX9_RHOML|nr:hypothetical protein RHMOL_Rhmol03G0197200 [Rhododendron molle]